MVAVVETMHAYPDARHCVQRQAKEPDEWMQPRDEWLAELRVVPASRGCMGPVDRNGPWVIAWETGLVCAGLSAPAFSGCGAGGHIRTTALSGMGQREIATSVTELGAAACGDQGVGVVVVAAG